MHIGLIAGGGELPRHIIEAAGQDGHDITVLALDGFADAGALTNSRSVGLAEFGKIVKIFKKAKCSHVCMAGLVTRPDFKKLKPDFKAMRHIPAAIRAAKEGDDALMRFLMGQFEREGFGIVAPQDVCASLLLSEGILGKIGLAEIYKSDTKKACETAMKIGELDIGQGAIVCQGVVLAVEAQEGTDAMLRRAAKLPETIRGSKSERKGVLAKMVKPGQDMRVDLPTIGPATVELAAAAGLAGIVAEAGRTFVIDRETVIALANETGMFIAGLPSSKA